MTALTWSHRAEDIPDSALEVSRTADAAELVRLAEELAVDACRDVNADYRIRRIGGGRYLMTGHVTARITQACVVTLEPVEQAIGERILVEIAAGTADPAGTEGAELAVLDEARELEPLVGGRIEAGRIVFETIAAAIDPYPRKDGAVFDWQDPKAASAAAPGPFASLARLKK